MHKRRPLLLMIISTLVLGLGVFFIVGCSSKASNPFDNMTITSNSSAVNLHIDVNDQGSIDYSASVLAGEIVFTVKGAPSSISRNVSVRSLDSSIAKVENVRFSNGKTTVDIIAENSGKTRIEALATGGRRMYVEVVVDVPAKDLSVKRDVHFGVLRGGSIEIMQGDFNFYATTTRVSSTYANPTLYDLEYEIVGGRDVNYNPVPSAAFNQLGNLRPTLNGAVLTVPEGYPHETVRVFPIFSHVGRQNLTEAEIERRIIEVHVFNPMPTAVNNNELSRISITNRTAGANQALPVGEDRKDPYLNMVLNAPAGSDYPVKNVAVLGVSLVGSGYKTTPLGTADGTGTRWGFYITNRDINALNARATVVGGSIGTIDLVAQGTGNVSLDIVFFPIGRDGTFFDFAYHRALQRTQTVSIEIRNVFREDTLTFTQNDGIASHINVFNAVTNGPAVLETFRLGILEDTDNTKLATTIINNTFNVKNNNNVFFYVKEVHRNSMGEITNESDVYIDEIYNGQPTGNQIRVGVLDLFNMFYYEYDFYTIGARVDSTHVNPESPIGLPYNYLYAMTIRNPVVLQGRELVLYAASIHGGSGTVRPVYARVPLNCVQAISNIDVHDEERTVPGDAKYGDKDWMPAGAIDTLYPVVGGSPVDFFVWTDENHVIKQMNVAFNGEGANTGETGKSIFVPDIAGDYYSLGYSKFVPKVGGLEGETEEQFTEMFRIYQRYGGTQSRSSKWELNIIAERPISVGLSYSFDLIHPSKVKETVKIMPLPKWERDPSIDLTEISGDTIYKKFLPHESEGGLGTLVAFVRVLGTYALDVRTTPTISFAGFDLVGLNSESEWEIVEAPTGLTVVPQELNRKWLRADAEGVYDLKIKVKTPNDEIAGIYREIFTVRIVVVDPVVSADIEPNGVDLLSKRSLGYDLALGLDQRESKLEFKALIGYASGTEPAAVQYDGGVFRRSTIIDFAFANMTVPVNGTTSYEFSDTSGGEHRTSVVRAASDVIEITRKNIGTVQDPVYSNAFTLQGLRPSGGEIDIVFKVRQVYELDGIVVPIDFALTGTSGGMNVSLRATVKDAVMIKSIIPYNIGEVIDITLNDPKNPVAQASTSVNTTIAPAAPYDNRGIGYLGYGFWDTSTGALVNTFITNPVTRERWAVLRHNYPDDQNAEVARVNVLSGEVIARRQNITTKQEVVLVIYALDSVQQGMPPETYIKIPIYIYDRADGFNQRVIANVEDFLEAFYIRNNNAHSFFENAKLDRSRGLWLTPRTDLGINGNSCYYQLIEDIDLSYIENGFTRYLQLPPIPHFGRDQSSVFSDDIGVEVSAIFTGSRSYALAGGIRNVNYTISNFKMMTNSDYYSWVWEDTQQTKRVMDYGFFSMVGQYGIIEGINFTEVSGYISGVTNVHETRFGVVAALNRGIVRDVVVSISDTLDDFIINAGSNNASNPGLNNIGLVVGRNDGTIEETALGQIRASGLLIFAMHTARLTPINFGGIVGLNNGELIKAEGMAALRENFMTNSDAALVVLNGRKVNYNLSGGEQGHSPAFYVNVGGIAGRNNGLIDGYSSEAVLHNSAYGNTGGVVGYNAELRDSTNTVVSVGELKNSFSNSAMYARSAMGGVVGRNFLGDIENCYYDLYLNENVSATLWRILGAGHIPAAYFGGTSFYAGMIVGTDGGNPTITTQDWYSGFTGTGSSASYYASPTVVGGVVGVNDSGNVRYSFASSAFSNGFTQFEMLNNMPYRGDIFIHNAQNVIAGGIIGRQDNTIQRSEVFGCYSTLSVFFDAGKHNPPASPTLDKGAPRIGGMIGFLNNAGADISYSYSNLSVNIVRDTSPTAGGLVYNGYWAHGGTVGDSSQFNYCYSVIQTGKTVIGGTALIDPVHSFSSVVVGFTQSAYVSSTTSAISKSIGLLRRFADATAMKTAFNLNWWDTNPWLAKDNFTYYSTTGNLFPYPLIFDGTEPGRNEPLVMASPHTITPRLKSSPEYAEIYGNHRNNQGGFNYVISNENQTRAALFYTVGLTTPSAILANRYYLADLFEPEVDPAIASKRIVYTIEGSSNLVEAGFEIDAFGRPRHYVDVKELGSFDVVMTSTRFVECSGSVGCMTCRGADGTGTQRCGKFFLATNRISFDIILGVSEMTATTGVAGLIGQKSLLNNDRMNTIVNTPIGRYAGQFNIQKNTPFIISGQTGTDFNWDIRMYGGRVYNCNVSGCNHSTCDLSDIDQINVDNGGWQPLNLQELSATVPGQPTNRMITSLKGTAYENNTSFAFNQLGRMEFAIVPYMTVGEEDYACYMLAFKIAVNVYGGAIELGFEQTVNTDDVLGGSVIDPSTSVLSRGVFTTDITQNNWNGCVQCAQGKTCLLPVPCGSGVTVAAERLLDLLSFRYITGQRVESLFADYKTQIATGKPVSTTLNKVGGQHISLYFELRVDGIEKVMEFGGLNVEDSGYYRYHFHLIVGIVVDSDGELYNRIMQDDIVSPLVAVAGTIQGMIAAEEILMSSEHVNARERRTFANLDVISQDLQRVETQHFATANWVINNGITTDNLEVDDNQHASNNIYTERDKGGLLKVYAVPYFSNIESFTLRHNKCIESCIFKGVNCTNKCEERDNKDKPWMQRVGTTDEQRDPQPIYEEWGISFEQMVYDLDERIYVKLPILSSEKYHQVSTTWRGAGGVQTYGWTGVYYLQTRLVEPEWQYTGERNDNKVRISGATLRIDSGKRFSLIADFVTNGGRKVIQSISLFTAEVPGLYFHYEGITTKNAQQAIGTEAPFRTSAVPAERITITKREVYIGNVPVEEAIGPTAPGTALSGIGARAGLVATRYDSGTDQYFINISHNYFTASSGGFKNLPVRIKFSYEREEDHGGSTNDESWLEITPVLFKIRGFGIDGISGNTVRLTTPNRQNMSLNIVSSHSPHPDLQGEIAAKREELRIAMNQGVNRDWLAWTTGGIRLNNGLDSDGFYKNNAQIGTEPGQINFFLGEFENRSKFIIDGVGQSATSSLSVEMFFSYSAGLPVITQSLGASTLRVVSSFTVTTINQSTEDNPHPIYQANVEVLRSMVPDGHYIIMEDLVLDNWTPVPFIAASLDGNSKKITINSFKLADANGNPLMPQDIGMFSTIGLNVSGNLLATTCVLKNINIALPNVSESLDIALSNFNYNSSVTGNRAIIRVGLLAGRNAGVITNCAVVNQQQFVREFLGANFGFANVVDYDKTTFNKSTRTGAQQLNVLIGNRNLDVRVGGLVGENLARGVISNSRVMIDVVVAPYYDQGSATELDVSDLNLAGFVAENYGTIVSSFYRDGNIINTVRARDAGRNLTSGFVGVNHQGSHVSASYVMGVSSDFDNRPGRRGTVMYGEMSSTYSTVAGFVQINSGTVEDCYVNIIIERASAASGFVMQNMGPIKNCFVNNVRQMVGGAYRIGLYYAFAESSTSSSDGVGNIANCVYVFGTSGTGNSRNFNRTEMATSIDEFNMHLISFFDDFSINSYTNDEEIITVWKMQSYTDEFGNPLFDAPELVSANTIAKSVRILEPRSNAQLYNIYSYVSNSALGIGNLGSKDNPVLITNGRQLNDYMYMHSGAQMRDALAGAVDYELNVYDNHMRLVNNIDLRRRASGGDLGDAGRGLMTYSTTFKGATFDGNGLNINGISFAATAATDRGLRSVGLFSKLEYATVKNLNLDFVPIAANMQISVEASNATYVGGLAGVSINSNISDVTVTGLRTSLIQGQSVVGGVVGMVVAFDTENETNANVIYNVNSNVPVKAIAREGTPIMNLIFESADEYIQHRYQDISVAGGLFGVVTSSPQAHTWMPPASGEPQRDLLRKDINGKIPTTMKAQKIDAHVQKIGNYGEQYIAVTGEVIGGLIGVIDTGIVINQANLNGLTNPDSSRFTGKFFVGGIVGANLGTLRSSDVKYSQGMQLASMAGNSFIFRSDPETICVDPGHVNLTSCNSSCTRITIYYNHHGMTVGGAVGFNRGIVDRVNVVAGLGLGTGASSSTSAFNSVWRLGGLVGENKGVAGVIGRVWNASLNGGVGAYQDANGGTIRNSTFGGSGVGINGGFYIGGLVGVNHGINSVIANNTVQVANNMWGGSTGGNFAGTITADSIFRSGMALNATYDMQTGVITQQHVFIDERLLPAVRYERSQYTGAYVGVNLDRATATINTINNSNYGYELAPNQRKIGSYVPPA